MWNKTIKDNHTAISVLEESKRFCGAYNALQSHMVISAVKHQAPPLASEGEPILKSSKSPKQ